MCMIACCMGYMFCLFVCLVCFFVSRIHLQRCSEHSDSFYDAVVSYSNGSIFDHESVLTSVYVHVNL